MIRGVLILWLAFGTALAQAPGQVPEFWPNRILMSGAVALAGGTVPPGRVEVAVFCGSNLLGKTSTDARGRFLVEVTRENVVGSGWNILANAGAIVPWPGPPSGPGGTLIERTGEISQNVGSIQYTLGKCFLRADAIPGYRPATLQLLAMRSSDVGVIFLPPARPGSTGTVSANTLAASDQARKAVENAQASLTGERSAFKKARRELEKALRDSPDFALAWGLLGRIELHEGRSNEARRAFEKAIAADETYDLAYLELARLDAKSKQWRSCAGNASSLLELDPNLAEAYYLHGAASYYLGQEEAAAQSFSAMEQRPTALRFPQGFFLYGIILARQNRTSEAAARLETFLRSSAADNSLEAVRAKVDRQLNSWAEAGLITRVKPAPH